MGTIIRAGDKGGGERGGGSGDQGLAPRAASSLNNSSIICEDSNKEDCCWQYCKRAHKCNGCGLKNHRLSTSGCTAKGENSWHSGEGCTGITADSIKVVESASLANDNSLQQPAGPKFKLADASKFSLANSPYHLTQALAQFDLLFQELDIWSRNCEMFPQFW